MKGKRISDDTEYNLFSFLNMFRSNIEERRVNKTYHKDIYISTVLASDTKLYETAIYIPSISEFIVVDEYKHKFLSRIGHYKWFLYIKMFEPSRLFSIQSEDWEEIDNKNYIKKGSNART